MLDQLRPIADPLDCKLIAILAAEGLSAFDIAGRLDVSEAQVLKVLQQPSTTKLIFKYQSVLKLTPEQQLQSALPRAVEKLIFLMNHAEDEKVQKASASEVIDRVNGKPIQTTIIGSMKNHEDVKQIDNNLHALQERLAKLEGQKTKLLESRGAVIDVPAA